MLAIGGLVMNPFRIAEMTKPYVEYDMIQKHTSLPELAEYRARLLLVFLNKSNQDSDHNELVTVATSLVQLGLDTHDLVPVTNLQKEEKDARSRQIKVLAGDYFSSRFYHILAQAGEIEMIKQLSDAICEVNRMKMNLYLRMNQMKVTAEVFLEQSVQIKMQLFLSFQHLMDGEQLRIWPEVLQLFALGEVLIEEIERSEGLVNFHNSFAYWHIFQTATKDEKKLLQAGEADKLRQLNLKYSSTPILQSHLDKNNERLLNQILQIESESLKHEIKLICEPFLKYQTA
jgi:heptaprenyl diphosphate synthase